MGLLGRQCLGSVAWEIRHGRDYEKHLLAGTTSGPRCYKFTPSQLSLILGAPTRGSVAGLFNSNPSILSPGLEQVALSPYPMLKRKCGAAGLSLKCPGF